MNSRWGQYVMSMQRGTQKELAERAGINPATLSRWLNGSVPSPEQVIAFARGISESPVQALVMAGYLTPREANMAVKDFDIKAINDVVLLDELRHRAVAREVR